MNDPSRDFSRQDLRNRSFRHRDLSGANFTEADIRGCNFSHASLVGANFAGVRAGRTWIQMICLWGVAVGIAVLSIEATLKTGFGAVGKTPNDRSWPFVVALVVTLSLAGMGSGIAALASSRMGSVAGAFSGVVSGAFLGFFYAGIVSGQDPKMAIAGAVLGGILMIPVTVKYRNRSLLKLAIAVAGTIASYGFALFIGVRAIAYGSAGIGTTATLLGGCCLLYLWFTLESGALAVRILKSSPGTSFEGADLTNACFEGARLDRTSFNRAKGFANPD